MRNYQKQWENNVDELIIIKSTDIIKRKTAYFVTFNISGIQQ